MKRLLLAGLISSALLAQIQDITRPEPFSGPGQAPQAVIGKGTISGTVVNFRSHEPVRKAQVMLNGAAQLNATTDSGGSFAFHSLPAGTYWLMANHEYLFANPVSGGNTKQVILGDSDEKSGIEIPLQPGASISGRVTNEDGDPVSNCNINATRSGSGQSVLRMGSVWGGNTDSEGVYRIRSLMPGRYVVRAQCGEVFPAPHGFMPRGDPLTPQEGYSSVSYGGEGSAGSAGMRISGGADLTDIDFHVTRVPMFLIMGALTGADNLQLNAVQLNLIPRENAASELPISTHADVRRGQYRFHNVPAGSYDLVATLINDDRAWEARESVTVGKTQIVELNLKLMPGPTLTGAVRGEDATMNLSGQQLALTPLDTGYRGSYPTAVVAADGTFVFKAILPGHFRFNGLQNGAYAKGFSLSGRDVSPDDFEVAESGSGPLLITAGNKPGTVDVTVESPGPAGSSVNGLLVSDPQGIPRVAGATVGTNAVTLQFPAVPPGKYRVLLLETQNAWLVGNSADLLKQLEARSVAVEVAESSEQHVSATMVSADDLQKAMDAAE